MSNRRTIPDQEGARMITGYKILRPDGTSVNCKWKYPLPVDGQPGAWTDVPNYGAFVSIRGEGLYCGGVPANWICVRVECEDYMSRTRWDVVRYRRVRVLEILADLPVTATVGNVVVESGGTLTLPVATAVDIVQVYQGGTLTLPVAAAVDIVEVYGGGTLNLPVTTTVGHVWMYRGGTLTFPVVAKVGRVWVESGGTLTIPATAQIDRILESGGTINRMEEQ